MKTPLWSRASPLHLSRDPLLRLAEKIHPISEIPQNWLIDPKGRRSVQSLNGHGEVWLRRVLMERVLGEP